MTIKALLVASRRSCQVIYSATANRRASPTVVPVLSFFEPRTRLFSSSFEEETTTHGTKEDTRSGSGPYLITTPIYYVNDVPHIGHAYTSTACDVLARFARLSGRPVLFLSGTDEHGQKVEASAARAGQDPQAFVNRVSGRFRDLLNELQISNDVFVRTTDEAHKEAVQHLWKTLVDRGAIYLGNYEGWYSVRDECYYTESELVNGKAPTGAEVQWVVKEPSYFFRLGDYQEKLLRFYDENPDFIAPRSRLNEVLAFVKGGLKDLSVSRTSFRWGVPVPDDNDHVVYVWIDALTNYLSFAGYPDGTNYDKFWSDLSATQIHVVGKDILRFHAVYWPALLLAAGLRPPSRIYAHGWWTNDGEKISKSLGNVVDPFDLIRIYGVDQTRFFLMSEVTFGMDGDFSHAAMQNRVNNNLANELGNLCQRTTSMVWKNCNGAIPTISDYSTEDRTILQRAYSLLPMVSEAMAHQAIHKYTGALIEMVWETNKYIDSMEPWALKKTDPVRMDTVLYVVMEILRVVAILYQPLMPSSSSAMLDQLTVPVDERSFVHVASSPLVHGRLLPGKPVGIFPRLELSEEEAEKLIDVPQ